MVGMESGTFRQLNSLSELHLESNLITSILPGTFVDNPKLVVLNLRNNRLSSLPVDVATLKNHIQELDLGENSIEKIDTYLVQRYYPQLRILDVSKNQITHMFSTSPIDNSSLEVIDVSFNYIATLDPTSLSSASKLQELNVSNNEIRSLNQDVFASNPDLVRVDVSNNHILTIHRDAFRNNPKITEIDAGSNDMIYLHRDTFSKNPQLTRVSVSWNKIQDIHPQTFYNNSNLEYIDFNNNKLKALNAAVFQNNPRLKSVDLRSNSLVAIHETTFHNNPKLEYLFLSRNKHIRFHDGLIIFASSLKVFDAQHCNLSELPADFFKNATDLRELHLGNNNFTSQDCVSNTSSNDYIGTLTKLQVLDLSNNQLQTVNVEVFRNNMTQLKTLRIEGNRFLCDCKLRNAWLWSQKEGIIPPQPEIMCTDVQQRSVPWDDVQHLNCSDESLTEETTSAVVGSPADMSTEQHRLNSTDESLTEDSTSAVIDWHADMSTEEHRLNPTDESLTEESIGLKIEEEHYVEWLGSGDIITGPDLDVNELSNSASVDDGLSDHIWIGIFFCVAVIAILLPLLFFVRKTYGTYEVSNAMCWMKNKNAASSTPAEACPTSVKCNGG
jgi:Leucine-rich repeat (LRR) protein